MKIVPKNVLPTSPINNFDGYQFQMRNPNSAPTSGYKLLLKVKAITKKQITKFVARIPSRPSIKFEKLIMAVVKNIRNIKRSEEVKKLLVIKKDFTLLECNKIKVAVKT